ncbi:MAG: pentapeptide repeat-containing protein [Alphaproteobacteria bacterium]
MQHFTLRKYTDNSILYSGQYNSFNECLEEAIKKTIELPHIDLSNKNLSNLNADGAIMPYADFSGSNLTGANLSESFLYNANFTNASLYNCCMSYADIRKCDFRGAGFGATLINGANIAESQFSTLSCFDLDFISCINTKNCRFIEPDYTPRDMSYPPTVIKGLLSTPIIVIGNHIKIGEKTLKYETVPILLQTLSTHAYQQIDRNNHEVA